MSEESLNPTVHGIEDIYRYYKEEQRRRGEEFVNYFTFTETLRRYNRKVQAHILSGGVYPMGHDLGEICIIKKQRNFENPTIDWGATNKLKKEENITQWVYYQDDYYYRWYWSKYKCKVVNRTVYSFVPSKGPDGSRKQLTKLLKTDEFASTYFTTREYVRYQPKP